jgi:hypothetical protein
MDDLLPNSYCSEVNRRLSEFAFLGFAIGERAAGLYDEDRPI